MQGGEIPAAESVKMRIFNALIDLMEDQPFREISITAIVRRAGVSRMAFYRAYASKEDVIRTWVDGMIAGYQVFSNLLNGQEHHINLKNITQIFTLYKEQSRIVLLCDNAKLGHFISDAITAYLHLHFTNSNGGGRRAYILEIYSSAIHTTAMKWLRGGMKESEEEMAEILYTVFGSLV